MGAEERRRKTLETRDRQPPMAYVLLLTIQAAIIAVLAGLFVGVLLLPIDRERGQRTLVRFARLTVTFAYGLGILAFIWILFSSILAD